MFSELMIMGAACTRRWEGRTRRAWSTTWTRSRSWRQSWAASGAYDPRTRRRKPTRPSWLRRREEDTKHHIFSLETSSVGSGHKIHRIQIRLEPYPTFTLYLRHLPVAVVQKSTIQNLLNNFQTFDKKNSKNKNSDEISLNPDQDTDSDPYLPNW